MTTPMWEHVVALEPEECVRLLSSARLGRVGLNTPDGPQVLPVNHAVMDGAIVFRTDLYGVLADGAQGDVVAFEVDELDDRMRSGWSVLVVGRAEHVEEHAEVADAFRRLGQPWAPGPRPLVARIVPSRVTGRRFTGGTSVQPTRVLGPTKL
jgi:nitroimidazol reductase NimA-like FMN-containing flavoprotein (pyridoxamine 5'-phosphate oxidase superfamily)